MKRFDIALLIGIVCTICFSSLTAFAQDCDAVRQDVVRLHILANSDSPEDQQLKLEVRDAILEDTADLFTHCATKEEAEQDAAAHLAEIEAAALRVIHQRGYEYDVQARMINRYFDTRYYENFTMPAGRYDALQVEIGAGQGKNWWCVMFPPMCIPAAAEQPETPLEEQVLQLGQTPRYKPAFAIVEMVEALREQARRMPPKEAKEPVR